MGMTMSEDVPKPDIVDRAAKALLATEGPDEPPSDITEKIRRDIDERCAVHPAQCVALSPSQGPVAWLTLTACVVLMIIGSWIVAFHGALFSRMAGRHIFPDETVFVHYTDGRVIARSNGDT
jgi:hypothetical protein